jgi:hypothetical protein
LPDQTRRGSQTGWHPCPVAFAYAN